MVTLRPGWERRLAELHSDAAEEERALERAAQLRPSPRGKGGRPPRTLPPELAAAVLEDLEQWSLRYVAAKRGVSYEWLRNAWRDGRLRRWAGA